MTGAPGFDIVRQRFLVALTDLMADRSIPEDQRRSEAASTVSAINQIMELARTTHAE